MNTIIGDLLDVREGVILHQVNCHGAVGGLAGALHAKWPRAFVPYFETCRKNGAFALGQFLLAEAMPGLHIGHVFGQINPGACTDISAVNESLGFAIPATHGMKIYAPYKMGCGIGGGDWPTYAAALDACFDELTIVQRSEDAE